MLFSFLSYEHLSIKITQPPTVALLLFLTACLKSSPLFKSWGGFSCLPGMAAGPSPPGLAPVLFAFHETLNCSLSGPLVAFQPTLKVLQPLWGGPSPLPLLATRSWPSSLRSCPALCFQSPTLLQ